MPRVSTDFTPEEHKGNPSRTRESTMEEQMQKSRDLKPHFEAILGRELEVDVLNGEVTLRERVATYDKQLEGWVTSRDIGTTGAATRACGPWYNLLDVSGVGHTGADGKVEFLLSGFHCVTGIRVHHPINFVATPRSTSPVFLTSLRSVTSGGGDVRITVSAWDPTGAPAGNTPFDWRCRVPYLVLEE